MNSRQPTDTWPDQKIRDIALFYIQRASMEPATWRSTQIGAVHPAVCERIVVQEGELPLVSCSLSATSWYLFTTRRILGVHDGQAYDMPCAEIQEFDVGDFKGHRGRQTDVMTLGFFDGRSVRLEYETGKASMAPIHCVLFWQRKYPVLDKLRCNPYCPYCGKRLRTEEARQCCHCGADWHDKKL